MDPIIYRATVGTPPHIDTNPGNENVRGLLSWWEQRVLQRVYQERKEHMFMIRIARLRRKRTAAT